MITCSEPIAFIYPDTTEECSRKVYCLQCRCCDKHCDCVEDDVITDEENDPYVDVYGLPGTDS